MSATSKSNSNNNANNDDSLLLVLSKGANFLSNLRQVGSAISLVIDTIVNALNAVYVNALISSI